METLREKIAARREALGIPKSDRPANKAEVRQWCLEASPAAIARLTETVLDDRVSHEAAIKAADTLLKYGLSSEDEAGGNGTVRIIGGLPDA